MDERATARERYLQRLRHWRNPAQRDVTLGGLSEHVRKHVVRPAEQVGRLADVWQQHVPAHLLERTTLAGFRQGVLTVHVADHGSHYELDRLLRGGLERRIKRSASMTLRRIRLRVVPES